QNRRLRATHQLMVENGSLPKQDPHCLTKPFHVFLKLLREEKNKRGATRPTMANGKTSPSRLQTNISFQRQQTNKFMAFRSILCATTALTRTSSTLVSRL
ncbi:unnamed protein product, partial [Ectocarpus sp. 12 AP-2014]